MKDEKDQENRKTPPKKPTGNGRGAQPVQGRGRNTGRPVHRFDVDVPGPGEPEKKEEAPIPEVSAAAPETSAARAKSPGSRERKVPAAAGPKPSGTAPKGEPRQAPATIGSPSGAEPTALAEEEPTVRFRKGQVPVKGPKPPKTANAQPRQAAAQSGTAAASRPRQGSPSAGRPAQPRQTGAQAAAAAVGTAGAGKPRQGGASAGKSAQPRQGAPVQRGGGRPGQESRGGQPAGVRGQGGNPPPRKPERGTPAGREPWYRGKERLFRRLYLVLTVISAIIVVGYVGFRFFAAPPDVKPPAITRPPVVTTTTDPDGNVVEVVQPDILSSDRKQEFYTFLVVGISQDEGGGLTDTMLLASYDVPNQKLSIMSLPRDIYVSENGRLLNAVYTRAGGGEEGIAALKEQVSKLTGVYPDYAIQLKWEAVGELVDAIGGVWFDVPRDMHYWDPTQNLRINVDKGYQLLDGEAAMGVVRFRATYVDGDLGRIKTQQAFLKALISQCLEMDNLLKNLGSYIDIFQRNVETELTVGNLTYFGTNALTGLDMDNVTFTTLPNTTPYEGCDHLVGIPRQIVVAVNKDFNPYKTDIHLGELDVVTNIPKPTPQPTPSESPDPEESETPDPEESETPDPEESPVESGKPGEGTVLPPGMTESPRPSARPTPTPGESEEPSSTPRPTPEPTPTPEPSQAPDPVLTPPVMPTAPAEEEPLLPPGV